MRSRRSGRYGSSRSPLSQEARLYSCQRLNQLLADSQILFALYKKHHWLVRGATFYQLHLLLDKHAGEQVALIDALAERVQTLGGVTVGDPRHVAEITRVPRAPELRGGPGDAVAAARGARADPRRRPRCPARVAELGDDGTNDLIVSEVIRTGELQAWFLAEHLVDTPLVRA
jgi:starvation-inducible DNA-binding protein